MTQEKKELLLKDLCARLPYGVILNTPNANKPLLALVSSKEYNTIIEYDDYRGFENDITEWEGGDVELIKPYLRPMKSMTKKEENYVYDLHIPFWRKEDYCNKHHLDYRGLIRMGLALEAPEGMYDDVKE